MPQNNLNKSTIMPAMARLHRTSLTEIKIKTTTNNIFWGTNLLTKYYYLN